MIPQTLPNHSKIGPRRLPNEASKNRRSQNPYFQRLCRFLIRFGPPMGPEGERGETHFSVPRRLQEEPGSQNAPQMLPRRPRMVPRPSLEPFWELFWTIFCSFWDALGSTLEPFSATRETQRQRDRESERHRHRETERPEEQQRQRHRETKRQRDRERQRERQTDRETERQRDRESERQRDRETERQSNEVRHGGGNLPAGQLDKVTT